MAGYICETDPTRSSGVDSAVAKSQTLDFLFMIDISPSMGNMIAAVKSGFMKLQQEIVKTDADAYFSIVQFGGPAQLRLPLTVRLPPIYLELTPTELV